MTMTACTEPQLPRVRLAVGALALAAPLLAACQAVAEDELEASLGGAGYTEAANEPGIVGYERRQLLAGFLPEVDGFERRDDAVNMVHDIGEPHESWQPEVTPSECGDLFRSRWLLTAEDLSTASGDAITQHNAYVPIGTGDGEPEIWFNVTVRAFADPALAQTITQSLLATDCREVVVTIWGNESTWPIVDIAEVTLDGVPEPAVRVEVEGMTGRRWDESGEVVETWEGPGQVEYLYVDGGYAMHVELAPFTAFDDDAEVATQIIRQFVEFFGDE
ncbi:hypothetical protein [Demequina maris]|uniref:hypothetical protein n=1 Tax=Demequina maris TaxID=1638982 RepID=UPI000782A5D3|nr:hypothetical protein [Demequina maris]